MPVHYSLRSTIPRGKMKMESNLKAENLFIILDNIKPHWADFFQNFEIHRYVAISVNNILYTTCIICYRNFFGN